MGCMTDSPMNNTMTLISFCSSDCVGTQHMLLGVLWFRKVILSLDCTLELPEELFQTYRCPDFTRRLILTLMWVLKRGDWFVFLKLLQKILEVHSGLWPLVWSEVSPWISSTRWSSARPLSHYHSCLPTIANSKFCHSSFWTSPRPAHQSPASLLPLSMRHHHHMPRPFWKPPHWTSPSLLALLRTSFCPPLDASPHGSQWYFFFSF